MIYPQIRKQLRMKQELNRCATTIILKTYQVPWHWCRSKCWWQKEFIRSKDLASVETTFIKALIQQSKKRIHLPPERIIWGYSVWQPLYTSLLEGFVEFHLRFTRTTPKVTKICYWFIYQREPPQEHMCDLYRTKCVNEKVIVPKVLIHIIWYCLKVPEMPHRITILQDKCI